MTTDIRPVTMTGQVKPRRDRLTGVYLHVPFCAKICPYCDFAVTARKRIPHEAYADAVAAELEVRADALRDRAVRTIYVGGGTPSLWATEQLAGTIDAIRARIDAPEQVEEVTLEANPQDVCQEALDAWAAVGITRLSIGCQSFTPRVLAALGRAHTVERAEEAVRAAVADGRFRVSLDLIFGGPSQTHEEWAQDLDVVAGLIDAGVHHVSAYSLTIEERTPFWRAHERGALNPCGEEDAALMLEALVARLDACGLTRYEVSSFAREGMHSRHNALYWLGGEYLGLGVGAHSLTIEQGRAARRANTRHLMPYLRAPLLGADVEAVSAHEHLLERAAIGLRTRLGLDWAELCHQFGEAVAPDSLDALREELDLLADSGLLTRHEPSLAAPNPVWSPTPRGWLVADALGSRLASRLL